MPGSKTINSKMVSRMTARGDRLRSTVRTNVPGDVMAVWCDVVNLVGKSVSLKWCVTNSVERVYLTAELGFLFSAVASFPSEFVIVVLVL